MNIKSLLRYRTNKKVLQISFLEAAFWAAFAVYSPFLTYFLKSKGYSNTTIGTITAINSIIVVFAQPLWGMISDKLQSIRRVFIICMCTAAILLQPLPLIRTVLLTGCLLAVETFFESPLGPLLDSWVIGTVKPEGVFYGHVRFLGSLSYAIVVLIFGVVISKFGTNIIFITFAFGTALNIYIASRIKTDTPVAALKFKDLKVGRLLSNYHYLTFLLFAIIIYVPARTYFIFLPTLIESVSGNSSHIGIYTMVSALSEIPVFLFGKNFMSKYKPVKLILASAALHILRSVLYSLASSPIHMILVAPIHGFSVSLFLSGMVYYIDSITPSELRSTSFTIATSIYSGISGIIGSYGGGYIIDTFGLNTVYAIGIISGISITLLFIVSTKLKLEPAAIPDSSKGIGGTSI
jgi:MFS family permease